MSYRTQSAGEQGVRWPVVWIIALIGVLLSIPMEGFCLTWDFNVDEDFEGWKAYGRIVSWGGGTLWMSVLDGVLKVEVLKGPTTAPRTPLLSPRLNVDTGLFDRIRVRMKMDGDRAVQGSLRMFWKTSLSPSGHELGRVLYDKYAVRLHQGKTTVFTPEWQTFEFGELDEQPTWEGEVIQIELYFDLYGAHEPESIVIDWIELTGPGEQALEEPLDVGPDTTRSGWFDPPAYYVLGYSVRQIGMGDLDGDGDLDVVVTGVVPGAGDEPLARKYTVLFNQGDGTLDGRMDYDLKETPFSIWIGDGDGDGDRDLVIGCVEGFIDVCLNRGGGTFEDPVIYRIGSSFIPSVWGEDLDGDGDVDLIMANWRNPSNPDRSEDTISLLFNAGDGSFSDPVRYEVGEHAANVRTADVDRDGDRDVIVACEGSYEGLGESGYEPVADYVYVLFNDGAGMLTDSEVYPVGDHPYEVWCGDLNGDSYVDLAVVHGAEDGRIAVLLNEGDGHFSEAVFYGAESQFSGLCGADLDGDGDMDLASGDPMDVNVSVLVNDGEGAFEIQRAYALESVPRYVCSGDMDGDGDVDIIGETRDGSVFVLLNRSNDVTSVEVETGQDIPRRYSLFWNYPNPFNSITLIPFDLAFSGKVRLTLYDMLGRKVRTLVEGFLSPGHYTIPWDGRDKLGHPVASGRYLVRLQAGPFSTSKTMMLVK